MTAPWVSPVAAARSVSRAEWERAQPKVLFPDADKNQLTARDVIVHTPRASDVAKQKAKAKQKAAAGAAK